MDPTITSWPGGQFLSQGVVPSYVFDSWPGGQFLSQGVVPSYVFEKLFALWISLLRITRSISNSVLAKHTLLIMETEFVF